MKAVRVHEHGGPEVLRWEDAPDMKTGPSDVRIRVRANAINHLDLWIRRGIPGVKIPLPRVVGSDAAGEVLETGSEVSGINPGDRVMVSPGLSCGHCEYCLSDRDNLCRKFGILGESFDGVQRSEVVINRRNVIPLSEDVSWETAVAGGLTYLTAWHMLKKKARLQAGETVLLWGVGSGVGSAALDICSLTGADAIATAGDDAKLERASAFGAKHVINHSTQDVAAEVKRITGKRGVDVVFEHPGQATWDTSLASLTKGGRLVTCGATTGWEAKVDLRFLFFKQFQLLGSTMGSYGDMVRVAHLVGEGKLNPVIDSSYPITDVAEAHGRIENREHYGRVVLVHD